MKINNNVITGIAAVIVGIMFIAMKGKVISLAITVLGIAMIIMGIMDITKSNKSGIIKIISGVAAISLGWLFVNIALYVVAALMIIYCVGSLISSLRTDGYPMSSIQSLRTYIKPVIGLVAGICLLLNQGGTVAWVFVLAGVIFVSEGVIMLSERR